MGASFDAALLKKLIAHAVRVVRDVPLETNPFPHVLVRGIWPADEYGRLLEMFPPLKLYEPFAYEKHKTSDGDSNRRRFQMSNAWLDRLSGETRTFWYSIRSALGSHELKNAIFEKLAPGLSHRYGVSPQAAQGLPGFALPELFHETQGYSIKPHPDTRKKVVTMQIALAADDSQEALGTEFYRRSMNPKAWLREPRGFEVVKCMPFLPNTAYAFSVLNTLTIKSWHGRTAIPGQLGVRNSMLNIWYERAENANLELVAEWNEISAASGKAA